MGVARRGGFVARYVHCAFGSRPSDAGVLIKRPQPRIQFDFHAFSYDVALGVRFGSLLVYLGCVAWGGACACANASACVCISTMDTYACEC